MQSLIEAKAKELSQLKHDIVKLRTKITEEIEEFKTITKRFDKMEQHFKVFLRIVTRLEEELLEAVNSKGGNTDVESDR